MGRVRFVVKSGDALSKIATSRKLGDQLEAIAKPALEFAQRDPNEAYVASLRMYRHTSKGRSPRVSIRIGAHPVIGSRVEAKRGTLQRALGHAGL